MSNFKTALSRVLIHEGGYSNNPADKGGETNFGITIGTARKYGYTGSMKTIPMTIVENIYEQQFWMKLDCRHYPFAFAFQLFDAGVNHGITNARKILQRAIGVKDDGIIGQQTMNALEKYPVSQLIFLFQAERIKFYTHISSFNTFGKGWMNRVAGNLKYYADDMEKRKN